MNMKATVFDEIKDKKKKKKKKKSWCDVTNISWGKMWY